ncbi:hypothetical protein JTB14_037870 [Gonioctena quinquepunctata]|nr:hypothetical protein JTB14_037870 [Gonioctena quinquepunctata]
MREHEIRKTQSIEKQKTNPEDIRKDENMDTTSSHENVEGSKPEELYVRLERLDKEDLKKREELWEKEILEDNLREKKKKEEKLNKQKQKDIINKGKAQTPPKKAAAKAPLEKSPLQTAYEEDQKEFKVKEAEHKRQLEIYRRTKEFHELQRTKRKESAAEEYFEHLSESAKEERNEQQEPKERRSTLPQEDDNLEDEYFNYLASSDDETTSEERIFSDGGTYMGQTITPRSGEDISLLEDQGKENMEINKQQQEISIEEEIPHIFPNVIVRNEPMDTQDEGNPPVSEDINDKIPTTKKGKKNKKKEEKMARKHKRLLGSRSYRNYSKEKLEEALGKVVDGTLSIREATRQFSMPFGTLYNRFKVIHGNNPGRPTISTHDEELTILKSAAKCADWGFPLSLLDMKMMAKYYLDRKGRTVQLFKTNLPGIDWTYSLLQRHKKSYGKRISTNIDRARASVSRETFGEFYDNLENTLRGLPSSNIFNYDKSNLSDDPGKKRGIYRRETSKLESAIERNLINSFRSTGIHPADRE